MTTRAHYLTLAGQAINQRQFREAHQACVTAIKTFGDDPHAYFLLGIIHIELGQINKAIRLLETSLSLEARTLTYVYLAKCHALKGDMTRAQHAAQHAPPDQIERALELDTLGVALSRVGDHQRALDYFTRALALCDDNPAFYYNFGVSCKFAGDFARANNAFEQALTLKPDYYQAHFALADLGTRPATQAWLDDLKTLQSTLAANQDAVLHLGHARAKLYESLGDYDSAFAALAEAKEPKQAVCRQAWTQFSAIFDYLDDRAATVSEIDAAAGSASQRPVFVLGMPRSGTTLVERIISHHSEVASGGELQDFGVTVKQLSHTPSPQVLDLATLMAAQTVDPADIGATYLERTDYLCEGKSRLVDKLPFNFFYTELILRAFPDARIVCLIREPMDTCIGNYRQLFSIHSPYYAYAYDLMTTGRLYQRFLTLMQSWAARFPEQIRLQSYEALVTSPESEVRDLLAFCNLPWEPQCLHVDKNAAPVSTASKVQVREPINARSLGRWKRYEAHLGELKTLFGKD
ncbi:tetratricopeptide repeat-containing sulfotransferase family protein [Alteromonas sp. CYL-A6]|uniref:tetratricopeptide repeat-containing sulfotransferase family protein n=1 Tax=Alteromonas nitratireducens TaxID=3390813 RepID=UPI0034B33E66